MSVPSDLILFHPARRFIVLKQFSTFCQSSDVSLVIHHFSFFTISFLPVLDARAAFPSAQQNQGAPSSRAWSLPPAARQAGGTPKVWHGAAVTEGVQNDSKRAERCFARLLFGLTLFNSELRLHLVGHLRADLVGFKYIALVERFRPHRRAAGAARGQLLKFVLL